MFSGLDSSGQDWDLQKASNAMTMEEREVLGKTTAVIYRYDTYIAWKYMYR